MGDGSLIEFEIGDSSSSYHALIGGATGSGKTVLLHNIILYGSYLYSEEELQFCLLDYKEGTEFQIYRDIPNVKVLAIESELEFGLSFLNYIQALISNRGKLFKRLGVSNLKEARNKTSDPIPRIAIVIDEFQVLLSDSFKQYRRVAELLDDITKRGRSFGVHLILSSQSLAGVGLKTSTLSQMPLRLVLKVNKDDSERFLSNGNLEPSFFKKRGQTIYNSNSGLIEDNRYFNVSLVDKSSFDKVCFENIAPKLIDNGLVKRIFDPSAEIFFDKTMSSSNKIIAGESFYMSNDKLHSLSLSSDHPSNIFIASTRPSDLLSFSMFAASQVCSDHKVYILLDKEPDEVADLGLEVVSSEERFLALCETIQGKTKEKGKVFVICPDITSLRFFKAKGFGKSKSSEAMVELIENAFDLDCNVLFGARSRQKLRDFIDFNKVSTEIYHRIILSSGTQMEQEFGIMSRW